jgi:hypothetical protein
LVRKYTELLTDDGSISLTDLQTQLKIPEIIEGTEAALESIGELKDTIDSNLKAEEKMQKEKASLADILLQNIVTVTPDLSPYAKISDTENKLKTLKKELSDDLKQQTETLAKAVDKNAELSVKELLQIDKNIKSQLKNYDTKLSILETELKDKIKKNGTSTAKELESVNSQLRELQQTSIQLRSLIREIEEKPEIEIEQFDGEKLRKEILAEIKKTLKKDKDALNKRLNIFAVPSGVGGGSALTIKDEGANIATATTSINFTGSGVTATASGNDVTVNITGGSGSGDRYKTTSTTLHTIVSTGTLTFTVDAGLSYIPLQEVVIVFDVSNHMHGSVVSYSGTSLVVDIKHKTGSGTYSNWTINLDGTPVDALTGSGTTNELAYFTGGQVLGSLSTTTYPSLTELSYVKGVTSDIQTQINGKITSVVAGENITVDNTDPANPVVASSVQSDPNKTILGTGVLGDELRFDQPVTGFSGGTVTLDDSSNYYHFLSDTSPTTFDFSGVGRSYKADFAVSPQDPQEMRISATSGGVIYAANQTFDNRVTAEATSVGSVATVRNNRGDLVFQSITGKWQAIDTVNGTKNIYGEVVCDTATSGILINNLGELTEAVSGDLDVSFFNNDVGYVESTGGVLNGEFRRTLTTLTDATSIALDLDLNNFYRVVLGGNRTLANPTNKPASGDRQVFILEVVQDGSGGRTLAFGTDYVLSVTPVLNSAINAVTHITCIATNNLIYVVGYA